MIYSKMLRPWCIEIEQVISDFLGNSTLSTEYNYDIDSLRFLV